MYEIIATDDFVNVIREMPLRHISVLTDSFVSIKKLDDEEQTTRNKDGFILDLLEQIRNQELE